MTLKTLLMATSIIALVFGLAFLLFPFQTDALYGYTLTREASFIPRYMGATFVGIAVLNWIAKDAIGEGIALRAVVLGNLVSSGLGLAVALLQAFNLPGNGLVWLNVVIYLGMVVGFGYFQFVRRDLTTHVRPPGAPIPH